MLCPSQQVYGMERRFLDTIYGQFYAVTETVSDVPFTYTALGQPDVIDSLYANPKQGVLPSRACSVLMFFLSAFPGKYSFEGPPLPAGLPPQIPSWFSPQSGANGREDSNQTDIYLNYYDVVMSESLVRVPPHLIRV